MTDKTLREQERGKPTQDAGHPSAPIGIGAQGFMMNKLTARTKSRIKLWVNMFLRRRGRRKRKVLSNVSIGRKLRDQVKLEMSSVELFVDTDDEGYLQSILRLC